MVLTSSGQVLTNYHVVEGASTISVTVAATGQTYQATVVGSDPTDDVALVQLTGASGLATITPDKDKAQVGDAVTAVGNAGGTGTLSAAAGTILSLTASVTAADQGSTASETLNSMVETNADVVAGDSGGPLFDAQGEVVGIDTAGSTGGQPDSYAIPIQRALGIAQQINSGTKTSTVRIGPAAFLGVELSSQPVYSQSGYGLAPHEPLWWRGGRRCGDRCSGSRRRHTGRRRHHQRRRAGHLVGSRRRHRAGDSEPGRQGRRRLDGPVWSAADGQRDPGRQPRRLTGSTPPWARPPSAVAFGLAVMIDV